MNWRLLYCCFGIALVTAGCEEQHRGLKVIEEPGRVVFHWRGNVGAPMLDKFKQAYGARAGDWRPIVISLDSNGGLVEHGSQVITFILKMQATHNVDTLVEGKSRCASMCVPIYLAGSRRKAAPEASFMFHEVSFSRKVDEKLREVKAENPQLDIRKAKNYLVSVGTDNLFERYLKTAGASEKWMAEMRRKVRGKDVWLSGRDLVDQRSGVVHGLL